MKNLALPNLDLEFCYLLFREIVRELLTTPLITDQAEQLAIQTLQEADALWKEEQEKIKKINLSGLSEDEKREISIPLNRAISGFSRACSDYVKIREKIRENKKGLVAELGLICRMKMKFFLLFSTILRERALAE